MLPDAIARISPDQRMDLVSVTCAQDSRHLGWDRVRVEDYPDLPASDIRLPGMDHHLLVYHYKALDGEFSHECAGRKTQTHLRDRQFSFIPAGADNRWHFGSGEPSALHLLVQEKLYENVIVGEKNMTSGQMLIDQFQYSSRKLMSLADLFWIEMRSGGACQLYIDTLSTALCLQISEAFSSKPVNNTYSPGTDVSVAREKIHADFAEQITLEELALLCELSRSQMVRCFRKQYGITPHRYQILCRIEHGKVLLRTRRNAPIAEMAQMLGFSDQSHFSRHFRAFTGQTPTEYRSSVV